MYAGYVVRIKTRPHPNADKLKLATAMGNQVVVGIDTPDDSIGIFFPCDGCLSREMLINNDLLPRIDEQGNKAGGYFDENGRVRSMKLRGERSDGIWLPLSCLFWINSELHFEIGQEITEIYGHSICYKYVNEKTQKAANNQPKIAKKWVNQHFKQHIDTEQFRFNVHKIKPGSLITITEKLHGTSFRIGRVLDRINVPYNFWERFKKLIGLPVEQKYKYEYCYMNGTRKTVVSDGTGFYGNEQFRIDLGNRLNGLLYKGETIYGELVGYTTTGKRIQSRVATFLVRKHDPEEYKKLKKLYGDYIEYNYGCNENQSRAFVYRITMTNEDGISFVLPEYQSRIRAAELGLEYVPEVMEPFVYNGDEEELRGIVEFRTEGTSLLDPSHIREGVVVRVDDKPYKNPSFIFKVLEGHIKDQGEIDMEESS